MRPGPRPVKTRVEGWLALNPTEVTATALARKLGLKVASVASCLRRLADEGKVVRRAKVGPRGGYGYVRKLTSLSDIIWNQAMEQIRKEMDRRVTEELLGRYSRPIIFDSLAGI